MVELPRTPPMYLEVASRDASIEASATEPTPGRGATHNGDAARRAQTPTVLVALQPQERPSPELLDTDQTDGHWGHLRLSLQLGLIILHAHSANPVARDK